MKNLFNLCLVAISVLITTVPAQAKSNYMRVSGGILNPDQFRGATEQAYAAAEQNPGLASKIFCYCGCDHEAGHKNLRDCFSSDHGTYCATCRGEMIKAAELAHEGESLPQIQRTIDNQFESAYPFRTSTPQLEAYRASEGKTTDFIASKKGRHKGSAM